MNITVLYNRVESLVFGKPADILADDDTVKTANEIFNSLKGLGYDTDIWAIDENNYVDIPSLDTDFVFNQACGIGSLPKSEFYVAELLERSGIAFSGSGSKAIKLTTDKYATKELLVKHGLPTPNCFCFSSDRAIKDVGLKFPVIIKPAVEDCSLGITGDSVQTSVSGMKRKVKEIYEEYRESVLVEEYIDGRELNITILGNGTNAKVLPISEILFGDSFKNKFKVVDFAAKWEEETEEYKDTTGHSCPAILEDSVFEEIKKISLAAYKITGCRDYARVDIRLGFDGKPYILEVNANPGIGPDDGALRSAKAAGYDYGGFLQEIILSSS